MDWTSISPDTLCVRKVDLSDVARDDRPGAEAQAGQEHLHLFGPGILSLIQDDKGVIEGSAPHEGQGSNFDHILFNSRAARSKSIMSWRAS